MAPGGDSARCRGPPASRGVGCDRADRRAAARCAQRGTGTPPGKPWTRARARRAWVMIMKPAAAPRTLGRRLLPLQIGMALQGLILWVPIEKLFMTQIGFD